MLAEKQDVPQAPRVAVVEDASPSPTPAIATPPAEAMEKPIPSGDPADMAPPLNLTFTPDRMPYEMQIEAIANRTDITDVMKSRFLLSMLPGLPEEAVAKAAEEATTRLTNKDYNDIALRTVTNPKTHEGAMAVLFADLMERPESIALPALLAIARNPEHPYAKHAAENLDLLLGRNHGNDWVAWDAAIQGKLAAPK